MATTKHEGEVAAGQNAGRSSATQRVSRPIGLLVLVVLLCFAGSARAQRERTRFNDGWRFQSGDPTGTGDSLSYTNLKPWLMPMRNAWLGQPSMSRPEGEPPLVAYARPFFDDRNWRQLNLPHDWGIEGHFQQELPGETGKLPWAGIGWYRKEFRVAASDAGRRFTLEVDGAMSYAAVWLNGEFVGGWPYGYSSWQVELTPHLRVGGRNVLAIRLDNPQDSSRWYPGGGIYRNVWLTKTGQVRVRRDGVFVTTPEISPASATIEIAVTLQSDAPTQAGEMVNVTTKIFGADQQGRKRGQPLVTTGPVAVELVSDLAAPAIFGARLAKPKLWSPAQPSLYVAETRVEKSGSVVDVVETTFGIRQAVFTATNGFLLNGRRLRLQGVCLHHDLGALGTAFNLRAAERQLEILKELGANAIRTAHNPPAPEFLDLCDRMGFLVVDEAFDCWKGRKKRGDYHRLFPDWHEADLRALVRRDRNHPSVILWSTGNEMPDQRNQAGVDLSRALTALVKSEDPTRPVTAGCNHDVAGFNGFQHTVDVFGYNYKPQLYEKFRAANPEIPLYSSESSSCVSSRGEYFFPVSNNKLEGRQDWQVSSYDLYAPLWALRPEAEFAAQDQFSYVAGEFVWTGFDYLGEPTPYNDDLTIMLNYSDPVERARVEQELRELGKIKVPARSSYFGLVDLAGFKKDRFYLYQSRWRPELRMAHILPHWNWPGREGEVTPVHVYTSGDEAELFLNGQSLGRKKKAALEYRLRWDDVKYAPGELQVVAYKNGKKWAKDHVRTTGPATKLLLEADRTKIAADGKDLAYVTVTVADQKGQLVPRAKHQLKFTIEGPGEIIATDNGDPTSFESFQAPERKAFNGLALVIVRAQSGRGGSITLKAGGDGLTPATVTIRAR